MVKLERYDSKYLPKGDYIFEKVKEFNRIYPFLTKKIDNTTWRLIYITPTIQEVRKFIELNSPDYIEIILLCRNETLQTIYMEYPNYEKEDKTKWQQYLDVIADYPKIIEQKASKELYKRSKGNLEVIIEVLQNLLDIDSNVVTLKHINQYLVKDNSIYGRDIILPIYLKNNLKVSARGSIYGKYKRYDSLKNFITLSDQLGDEAAFYICRKCIFNLYDMKLKYINGERVNEPELMSFIDIYSLAHAKLLFTFSNTNQGIVVIIDLIERNTSKNIIIDFMIERMVM